MSVATVLPTATTTSRRAHEILAAWAADPEMPETSGSMADAVKVMALRAALYDATRDPDVSGLPAPAPVEMSAALLTAQFPELDGVAARTGHPFLLGNGSEWHSGGYAHRVYRAAFGPDRHWPA